jgi:hypothetical protein
MFMKAMQAAAAAVAWTATIAVAGPASADPEAGPCDPQALTVNTSWAQPGLGHRAVQLNFTLPAGAGACQLSGYPTVDAEVIGAAPIHAEQTSQGYLGGATPGTTVTLQPGHDAHAMVEWVAATGKQGPPCQIYGSSGADVTLRVTPPGMAQTFTVPISVGRNEGLCWLQVHPLTG